MQQCRNPHIVHRITRPPEPMAQEGQRDQQDPIFFGPPTRSDFFFKNIPRRAGPMMSRARQADTYLSKIWGL